VKDGGRCKEFGAGRSNLYAPETALSVSLKPVGGVGGAAPHTANEPWGRRSWRRIPRAKLQASAPNSTDLVSQENVYVRVLGHEQLESS
jgi:hypothetical protein